MIMDIEKLPIYRKIKHIIDYVNEDPERNRKILIQLMLHNKLINVFVLNNSLNKVPDINKITFENAINNLLKSCNDDNPYNIRLSAIFTNEVGMTKRLYNDDIVKIKTENIHQIAECKDIDGFIKTIKTTGCNVDSYINIYISKSLLKIYKDLDILLFKRIFDDAGLNVNIYLDAYHTKLHNGLIKFSSKFKPRFGNLEDTKIHATVDFGSAILHFTLSNLK